MADRYARQQEELAKERRRSQDLDGEIQQLQEEIKAAKLANATRRDTHEYNEADTRTHIIDLMLKEAGWALDKPEDREYPVDGLPTKSGKGYIDYVLWDADGKPLGIVEAKATTTSEIAGQQQAKEYADALEVKFGTRPVIFYTNGYETRIWDDTFYPPRPIQGFYTKDELRSLISRRASRQALNSAVINEEIVQRYYQSRAIRKIGEAFEKGQRHALLVMATGSGKTRTAIALVDLLQKAGWVKRVLFLADRKELVTQATNAFKAHLPGTPVVNLVTEKDDNARVYVSTYPTMLNLINKVSDQGHRKFGPGYFDLIIIDEAHRSIFNKYKAIFDYFDALLVGLTATPKNEIDRNTYRVFNLEEGNPTDAYSLDEAMADTYLVGPFTINVPLKIPQLGIKYNDLSDEEKEKWDEVEWDDDDGTPAEVSADEVNKYLFNADTIDKMLQTVMTYGLKVEGGDRLGKTIIFARNNKHAEFIVDRFNKIYPEQPGDFARVITYQIKGAEHLIGKFRSRIPRRISRYRSTCWTPASTYPRSSTWFSRSWSGRRLSSGRCSAGVPGFAQTCSDLARIRSSSSSSMSPATSSTLTPTFPRPMPKSSCRWASACSRSAPSCCTRWTTSTRSWPLSPLPLSPQAMPPSVAVSRPGCRPRSRVWTATTSRFGSTFVKWTSTSTPTPGSRSVPRNATN